MTLRQWLSHTGHGALSLLQRETGLAYTTILRARDCGRVTAQTALAIERATRRRVSASDVLRLRGNRAA